MKPPIPYFGGKITAGRAIAALLPPHAHYVEPYCGSLAVLLAKPAAPHETVNDLDHILMTFWRVLRERPADLARVCALTPHSRAEYDQAQTLDATDELDLARQVFVKLTQGRGGLLRRTGWRHYVNPAGSKPGMPGYLAGYPSDLYDRELYPGWDRHTIAASTGQGNAWANRTEVLWSNRPLGIQPSLFPDSTRLEAPC